MDIKVCHQYSLISLFSTTQSIDDLTLEKPMIATDNLLSDPKVHDSCLYLDEWRFKLATAFRAHDLRLLESNESKRCLLIIPMSKRFFNVLVLSIWSGAVSLNKFHFFFMESGAGVEFNVSRSNPHANKRKAATPRH